MQQPIIMSPHHAQIAYAAQTTANFQNYSHRKNSLPTNSTQMGATPVQPFYYYPAPGITAPVAPNGPHMIIPEPYCSNKLQGFYQHPNYAKSRYYSPYPYYPVDQEAISPGSPRSHSPSSSTSNQSPPTKTKYHGLPRNSIASHKTSSTGYTTKSTPDEEQKKPTKKSEKAELKSTCGTSSSGDEITGKSKKVKPVKPVKKVIVINLPGRMQTVESVTMHFQKFGEIVLVRVLKPGKILPFDLKQYATKISDLGTTLCAIVEFETTTSAKLTVDTETQNDLRLALLQPGADIALYGAPAGSASPSIHSSQITHEESGVEVGDFHGSSSASHIDNLSQNSGDDDNRKPDVIRLNQVRTRDSSPPAPANSKKPASKKLTSKVSFDPTAPSIKEIRKYLSGKKRHSMPTLTNQRTCGWPVMGGIPENKELKTVDKTDGKSDKSEEDSGKMLNAQAPEFVPRQPNKPVVIDQEPKITNTQNGRVMTSINVILTPVPYRYPTRTIHKLDLTGQRHSRIEEVSSTVFVNAIPSGNSASNALTINIPDYNVRRSSTTSPVPISEIQVQKYSRDYLLSLKESKKSLQLPLNLPNIPELIPTAKQQVVSNTPKHSNTRHNFYKYNNNQHHNNHFNNQTKQASN